MNLYRDIISLCLKNLVVLSMLFYRYVRLQCNLQHVSLCQKFRTASETRDQLLFEMGF